MDTTRTNEIISKLKHIPVSEFKRNKDLYEDRVNLNPSVEKYKNKFDYYSVKLDDKRERIRRGAESRKRT